jgi:carbamoyltransferase
MPQLILGVHPGPHDATAALFDGYTLKSAVQLERLTRLKGDGHIFPDPAIDEVLSIAGATRRDVDVVVFSRGMFPTRYYRTLEGWRWLHEQYRGYVKGRTRRMLVEDLVRLRTTRATDVFDVASFQRELGFRDGVVTDFYNHHEAHALAPLFYSPWNDAFLATADAGGDMVHYSYRHFADGALTTLFGGDECIVAPPPEDSLGKMYSAATKALGFRPVRHEGKVTGLAAMGEPVLARKIAARFSVDEAGRIHCNLPTDRHIRVFIRLLAGGVRREDVAASVQKVLEDVMLLSLQRMLARHPSRNLGASGGIFANVKLNRLLAEELPLDELFIFPAMGDEGLAVGGVLCWLLRRDGLKAWLANRQPLGDVYLGRDHSDAIDGALSGTTGVRRTGEPPVDGAVRRLAAGEIGAIYTGRMEYGPRALGARSILANPSRRDTHDLLNLRLDRSEFMPFAPVIAAERAADVFDITPVNARACRYMTIACDVRPEWRARIPAVVHVDGSARPQIIERADNPTYYDILTAFERATGLPVLVNTSFNVHEEPIVNAPGECVQALVDGRVDFVVTDQALYARSEPARAAPAHQ